MDRLSSATIKKLSNKKEMLAALKGGQSGQILFGFTDEEMGKFYLTAHHLLEEKNAQAAVDSFVFLVTLNPFHSEYWMGLGAALQLNHDYEAAVDAYEIAAIYNLEHPLPYLYLAKCLFAMHDRVSALQALDLAISYSGEAEEFADLKKEAEIAKEHLLDAM